MLLGQILVKEGFCFEKDILLALDKQRAGDKRFLGEILLEDGAITNEQLKESLQIQFGSFKKSLFKPKWIRLWKSVKKALFQ